MRKEFPFIKIFQLMKKNILIVLASVVISCVCSAAIARHSSMGTGVSSESGARSGASALDYDGVFAGSAPDFVYAAEHSVDAVVNVKVVKQAGTPRNMSFLQQFFGYDIQPQQSLSSGSGVIITQDGYIVTNNHVVEGSTQLLVTLNSQKSFSASVVGSDPVTDIALIKIESDSLPSIPMGDSDSLRLGQWVLAIGCPYSMNNTVTAGIVSAKGRALDNGNVNKIESYIQTDAAVNPGNSGGALVNLKGELVGINTAIASPTGAFAGYSFAVPSTIVKKIVADLLQYGKVQRAQLGVMMTTLNTEVARYLGVSDKTQGAVITDLVPNGPAQKAGIKVNDIITAVDGHKITSANELQERINIHRPGDGVNISVSRDGKQLDIQLVLQEMDSNGYMGNRQMMMRQYQQQPKNQPQYGNPDPFDWF